MSKSAFTEAHKLLVETLVAARRETGMLQAEVAARLGKHQSYISNIERGERRVDVVEFYALARALGADPARLYERFASRLPKRVDV